MNIEFSLSCADCITTSINKSDVNWIFSIYYKVQVKKSSFQKCWNQDTELQDTVLTLTVICRNRTPYPPTLSKKGLIPEFAPFQSCQFLPRSAAHKRSCRGSYSDMSLYNITSCHISKVSNKLAWNFYSKTTHSKLTSFSNAFRKSPTLF